jgi:hypothetical protein
MVSIVSLFTSGRCVINFNVTIFVESVSQERHVLPQILETDAAKYHGMLLIGLFRRKFCLIYTYILLLDDLTNQSLFHGKRSFDEGDIVSIQ